MRLVAFLVAGVTVLSACNNSVPAGGPGPFDPPPPAPVPDPYAYPAPQTAGTGDNGAQTADANGAPRSAVTVNPDPNAQLAQDVTSVLQSTAPAGAAAPVATAPASTVTTTPVPTAPQTMPGAAEIGVDPNADSIDLNQSSLEVQKRQREAAEARRQAAESQLVIVEPEPVPQQDINANVVAFARQTTHPVGTKVYNRPVFRDRFQSASVCRRFESDEEAQRQFLSTGGPNNDRYNLDPDGDGFACGFDPERYRRLNF